MTRRSSSQDDDRARPRAANVAARCSHGCAHMDPYRADLLLASVLLVGGLLEVVFLLPEGTPRPAASSALLIAGLAGCVAIRRRFPIVAADRRDGRCSCAYPALDNEYTTTWSARSSSRSSSSTASAAISRAGSCGLLTACAVVLMSIFTAVEQSATTARQLRDRRSARWSVAPVLLGRVIRNRAHLNRGAAREGRAARARARRPRGGRRARGARADRRRAARRRRARAQRDGRAGLRRAPAGRARPRSARPTRSWRSRRAAARR